MISLHHDEHEPSAKRETCKPCGKITIPHEQTDQGHLCRRCTDSATEIRIEFVIAGRTYTKHLRRLSAVESPGKKKTAVIQTAAISRKGN